MDEDFKKLEDTNMKDEEKIIIFHGFSKETLLKIMDAIKKTTKGEDIIMAITTPTSLEWKVKDLVEELSQEHRYMKKERE